MKSTGIIRQVDELGRIVLPIELRRTMDINEKDGIEIFVEEDTIILRKHQKSCVFCGQAEDNMQLLRGKHICRSCSKQIK